MVHPSSLRGVQNGEIPSDRLELVGVGSARQERTAARSWKALFAEMRRATGIELRHVGEYRSYDQQVRLFTSRYEPCSAATYWVTPSSRRKQWPDEPRKPDLLKGRTYWRKIRRPDGSYPATAATPGTSNHGWGLALDLAEEYDSDTSPDPIRTHMVQWLCDNAHRFGISAELQSEPWHWRYVAGDNIPRATLDWERGEAGPGEPDYPKPTLRVGSKGAEVRKFQEHFNFWRCEGRGPITVDGDFGAQTEAAMRAFQRGLGVGDDGVYGPVTANRYRDVLVLLRGR